MRPHTRSFAACRFSSPSSSTLAGSARATAFVFGSSNSPEWVAAFFGCLLRGVIAVPLDLESSPEFVSRVQKQVQARLLLAGREQPATSLGLPVLFLEDLQKWVARHSSSPVEIKGLASNDIAEIIFTSGTTAEPKGVCITHGNLLANRRGA